MKTKSYNNINTITKNRKIKNIKKTNITKKNTKKEKSCLNFVASEAEKRKKIHKVC
jgi:hypothetical protein